MKPHFFGSSEAPLYGLYNEPRVDVDEAAAVLICYPIAGEYMRAHRACRQLTNLLARRGAHVMRFDYFGTGDSFGGAEDSDLDRWQSDIGAAAEELIALCGARRVKLVGLRLGAALGLLGAGRHTMIDQVVLWDPIVDGAEYVRELESRHAAEQAGRGADPSVNGMIGVNGFGVPRSLREQIAGLDLTTWRPERDFNVDVVVSSEKEEWAALEAHLATLPGSNTFTVEPSAGDWGEADEFGSALIPQQIIQSVVSRLLGDDA